MKTTRLTMGLLAALLAVFALGLTACGDDDDDGGGEEVTSDVDLSGASFTVGSKEFTEQLILGEITKQLLEASGAEVSDQLGLEGSQAARRALTSGEIDTYWEYTGTAWTNYLGHDDPIPDEQEQFDAVEEEDAQKNDIVWVPPPTPFNNTYAIAVRSDADEEALNEVETLSDLGELSQSNPDLATFCVGEEFSTRPDGFRGMTETYDIEVSNESVVGDSVVYQQVADGSDCNFGSIFATDGRVDSLDLRVLEDDENFFPFFNAALNVRQQALEGNEGLEELFVPVAEALDDETMTALNARVDVDGERPEDVASDFLEEEGLTG